MADRLAELQPRGMEALNSRPLVEAILKGMTPYYAEDTPPQMITPGMGPQKLQGTVAPNPLPWAAVDAASMFAGLGAKGAGSLATLYLTPGMSSWGSDRISHRMVNELGKVKGPLSIVFNPENKTAWVDWIGGDYSTGPNTIGLKDIRSLVHAVAAEYPEATRVGGFRVSGARGATGQQADAYMNLPKLTEKQIEDYQLGRESALLMKQNADTNASLMRSLEAARPPVQPSRTPGVPTAEEIRRSSAIRQGPYPGNDETERALNAILQTLRAGGL